MSALISPQELMANPADVLLDVQWQLSAPDRTPCAEPVGLADYQRAHLPEAHFVDLETVLADPVRDDRVGGRHPLPDPGRVQSFLRSVGTDDDSRVVVYDGGSSMSAARAWWVLRWLGLEEVQVLDGGLAAWTRAGGATTQQVPTIDRAGAVTLHADALPTLDADAALALAREGVLLDARAAERYSGQTEPLDPVAGHIPGAVSAPTTENVGPDGRFLPADQLRTRFAALGADGSRPVGAYCGSGVTAAHQLLALHEAGVDAVLYPGSWSDWTADPSRDVATGER